LKTLNTPERNRIKKPRQNGNMRLTRPSESRSFGLLHIDEEARVLELETSYESRAGTDGQGSSAEACFSGQALDKVLSEMVIVVPCKDEQLAVIRGVISAIPAACFVILVSNCQREDGDDEYEQQVAMVKAFGGYDRQILAIHQKDAAAAAAFCASGMAELIDPADGTIRDGKGEGMLLGVAMAAAFCHERHYIGFVDADNFNAGSVNEYCKAFAAGFAMSPRPEQEDTMVRLRWSSKPKMRNGRLDFVTEGRCSRIVNSWLDKLLVPGPQQEDNNHRGQPHTKPDNPFVTTGNAGEHAMTMSLALKLRMAAGYAIEPFHFIDLLERAHLRSSSGGKQVNGLDGANRTNGNSWWIADKATKTTNPLDKPVRVLQIRTLSPHFHRSSDDEHIRQMWATGLGSIFHGLAPYHSMPRCDDDGVSKLRQHIHDFAATNGGIDDATGELPQPNIYPALEGIDLKRFRAVLGPSAGTGSLMAYGLSLQEQEDLSRTRLTAFYFACFLSALGVFRQFVAAFATHSWTGTVARHL
jgi:mannosyl-3-phosphoglycerate synthase